MTTTECIIAPGVKDKGGYGRARFAGRRWRAHRLAWTLANGPIPRGQHVLHRCDVPACINPDHLFIGSNADNVIDRDAKGRQASGDRHGLRLHPDRRARGERNVSVAHPELFAGERNGRARLTGEDVRVIRTSGESRRAIARRFGVSRRAIQHIVAGTTWCQD